MNKSKVKILFVDFVLFIILLAGDRFTKYLAIAKLKEQDAIVLIQDVLELQYLENRGSAFGMFQNQKVFILCVGTIFMVLVIAGSSLISVYAGSLMMGLAMLWAGTSTRSGAFQRRRRRALDTTQKELRLMAAAPNMGLSIKSVMPRA